MRVTTVTTPRGSAYYSSVVRVLENGRYARLPPPKGFVWRSKEWRTPGSKDVRMRMSRQESVVTVNGADYRISITGRSAKPFTLAPGEEFREASDPRNAHSFD